jgi:hypothetical protein
MLTDGRTQRKLLVAFRNLANAPEKGWAFWAGTYNRVAQTCGVYSVHSPVFRSLPLIVGIRVNLDGNDKNLGNV